MGRQIIIQVNTDEMRKTRLSLISLSAGVNSCLYKVGHSIRLNSSQSQKNLRLLICVCINENPFCFPFFAVFRRMFSHLNTIAIL